VSFMAIFVMLEYRWAPSAGITSSLVTTATLQYWQRSSTEARQVSCGFGSCQAGRIRIPSSRPDGSLLAFNQPAGPMARGLALAVAASGGRQGDAELKLYRGRLPYDS
jgi:hypothetical protein